MKAIFKAGQADQPIFVLLHGTGGDEHSLLAIADFLNPDANVLSLRGDVDENGLLRFFKRHGEGHFDLDDLEKRGQALLAFLKEASTEHHLDLNRTVLVGFSNGANMAINLLLADGSPLTKGMLFAPMYPVPIDHLRESKADTSVFLSMGKRDPIATLEDSQTVIELFQKRLAQVQTFWVGSHEITRESLEAAKDWLKKQDFYEDLPLTIQTRTDN
ncbi:alpha/beta hydrolase [Streptococcus ictaluri]|uniref:Phospholipase/carboxylesterase n=1 Tax=Streptococcus ictaluri 707-05 TaxID=764299 RepID=G5JZB6_9STRE|nr:alpha/beta hydrolase [Streptococcus ictaluri]EHI70725.1 phospholipase/carboxylesterase [Streptococcus ictaluri 707-05]